MYKIDMSLNPLTRLLQPAKAARLDAVRMIESVPASADRPLASLLRDVRNADLKCGYPPGLAEKALEQHVKGEQRLKAVELLASVRHLKHTYHARSQNFARNSAGMQPGSSHHCQWTAVSRVEDAARSFNWQVAVAGRALGKEAAAAAAASASAATAPPLSSILNDVMPRPSANA